MTGSPPRRRTTRRPIAGLGQNGREVDAGRGRLGRADRCRLGLPPLLDPFVRVLLAVGVAEAHRLFLETDLRVLILVLPLRDRLLGADVETDVLVDAIDEVDG